jgi:hypothetical protein
MSGSPEICFSRQFKIPAGRASNSGEIAGAQLYARDFRARGVVIMGNGTA